MKNSAVIYVLIVVVILLLYCFSVRNNLVDLQEDVNMQKAQIETQLQRRNDLIPNLVSTVKGYASHEEEVFTEIANARAKLAGSIESGNIDEISSANASLDSALGKLLAISEAYPELKANEQFTALMDELAGTENRISVARQYYNEKVSAYNRKVQHLPTNFVATIFGFSPMPYFEASEVAHEVPTVNFDS